MSQLLSIDPGSNSGLALGYFDATTPYRLLKRWQIHGGLDGFLKWVDTELPAFDEIVCERFILSGENEFTADLTPKEIEGALTALRRYHPRFRVPFAFQPRSDKSLLTGYPKEAVTKAQRQRVRFDFLDRFGLFKAGTENDDSNDAITHGLVNLKLRHHRPTLKAYWPGGLALVT